MKAASKELCPLGALRRWAQCRACAGTCRCVQCSGPFLWLLSMTLVARGVQRATKIGISQRLDKNKEGHDDGDSE